MIASQNPQESLNFKKEEIIPLPERKKVKQAAKNRKKLLKPKSRNRKRKKRKQKKRVINSRAP